MKVLERIERLEKQTGAATDVHAAERQAELARCAGDPVYWVSTYGWTFDPRETPSEMRFELFPRQEEFLRWLQEREALQEEGIVEKSRDMGLTWLCIVYALHGWLFRSGFSAGFGSRKLELVDRIGDPACIFEKARLFLRRLPTWMLPLGFDWRQHDNWCKLLNPANGSSITGEGGDEIGRGGRATIYFVDEHAFLEHPARVEAALSQTTRVKVRVSTPNGPGNAFYRLRHSGKIPVFTFHWRDDPRKGDEWYRRQAAVLHPATLAQEVDIDYTGSLEGLCIPAAWARSGVGLRLRWADGTPYEARGKVVAGFDVGEASNTVVLRRGPVVLSVHQRACDVDTATWWAVDLAEQAGAEALFYDCQGPGAKVAGVIASGSRQTRVRVVPVNGGAPVPDDRVLPDGRRACEQYANIRAYVWDGIMGERLRKSWERREREIAHKPDELLLLPDDPQLQVELSVPLRKTASNGRTLLESKLEMQVRGVASPHRADALSLTFAPAPVPVSARFPDAEYIVDRRLGG